MIKVLILMLLSSSVFANDGDLRLTTFIGSHHAEDKDYCEFNPGLGVQYFISDHVSVHGGAYKNSQCRLAAFAMGGVETDTDMWVGLGFSAGFVSGYDSDEIATQPFVAYPYVRFGSNKDLVQAKMLIVPGNSGVIGLSLSWRIK